MAMRNYRNSKKELMGNIIKEYLIMTKFYSLDREVKLSGFTKEGLKKTNLSSAKNLTCWILKIHSNTSILRLPVNLHGSLIYFKAEKLQIKKTLKSILSLMKVL